MRSIFYTLFFFFLTTKATSQILSDAAAKQQLLLGVEKLYNYQFNESTVIFNKLKVKYNNHPALHLLAAMQLQIQSPGFETDPKLKAKYINHLTACIKTATTQLETPTLNSEATFFLLAAHGYMTLVYNYEKEYMNAANEARKAYGFLKDGFDLMESNPEFYFSTGLYNFYMIQYPKTHPITKPIVVFFSGGNKKLGLQQLENAVKHALFTKVEATYYLVNVLLKYENNPSRALIHTTVLNEKYPNNLSFLMRHTEALVLSEKYEDAIETNQLLRKNNNRIYQIAANTFDGLIAEKNLKDDKKAAGFYKTALAQPFDERHTKNYHAMAFAGLARVAIRAKNLPLARQNYEKCVKIAEYESLKAESKGFLK